MIDDLKETINKIRSEIAELDKAAGNANSEPELNAIGAEVVALEIKLKPLREALLLAEELSKNLAAVKRKTIRL